MTKFLGKRKAAPKVSKDEAATSRARDVSPLRNKCRLLFVVINTSSKEIPFAEKTKVRIASSLSARVKHLVGVDSKKVGGM